MRRTLVAAFAGLLLGGIIHIVLILILPAFSNRDAWSSVGRFGADGAFHLLPMAEAGTEALPFLDPFMAHAVCRYTIGDRPLRIRAELPDTFWSFAVFDRRGRNAYSLNDRAADRTALDLILATRAQLVRLRQDGPDYLDRAVLVEAPSETGFVLIRALEADASVKPAVDSALGQAICSAPLDDRPARPATAAPPSPVPQSRPQR